MRLSVLHLDDGLTHQHSFLDTCRTMDAREIDAREAGRHFRLWGKERELQSFKSQLPKNGGAQLTFMGSGDFHHVTALLLERLAETDTTPITVIHFDNHPDWVHCSGGMHCGSWVNRALALPNVAKVITLGVCSRDLKWPEFKRANLTHLQTGRLEIFPYSHPPSLVLGRYGSGASHHQENRALHWHTMELQGDDVFLEQLLSRIATEAIYITVDKDVLAVDDVTTNWDQGKMRLPQLLGMIAALGEKFRIVGADVIGDYSTPDYGGSQWTRLKKRAEIALDQPRQRATSEGASALNARSNLALLNVFSEVMA